MPNFKNHFFVKKEVFSILRMDSSNRAYYLNNVANVSFKPFFQKAKIVLFLVLFVSLSNAFAQRDLIKTQAGEGIRCKIIEETPTRFIYSYVNKNGKVLKSEIFKSLVSDFKYNYFQEDLVDAKGKVIKEFSQSDTKTTQVQSKKSKEEVAMPKKEEVSTPKVVTPKENIATTETSVPKEEKTIIADEKLKEVQKSPPPPPTISKKQAKPKKTQVPVTKPEVEKKVLAEEPKKEIVPAIDEKMLNPRNPYKFRVGVRAGLAGALAHLATSTAYGKYLQGLEKGSLFGADFAYFPTKNFGLGLMYTNFQSNNNATDINFSSLVNLSQTDLTGTISDRTSTKFIGIPLFYRAKLNSNLFIVLGAAPGINLYKDTRTETIGTNPSSTVNVKGKQVGGAATLGLDFLLGKRPKGHEVILSLEGGYNYAKFNKLDYGSGANTLLTPFDNSHWSVTLGLRFTRYPKYLSLASY